nr:DUF4221 domain-containing protein [Cytophagales bacterium]
MLLGCGEHPSKGIMRIVEVEEVVFTANDFISVNPAFTRMIETDSSNLLFAYNHVSKTFQFIDMETGNVEKEVPLRYEGPNSVQGITGATLTSLDSIWILLSRPPRLALLNFEGEIVSEKEITNTLRTFPISYLFVNSGTPLIQYKSTLFGAQPLLEGHHQLTKDDLNKYQLLYSFDFQKDETKWYDVFYPENYWDSGKKLSDFSWADAGNELYIAPTYDHEIQIFDMNSGALKDRRQVKSSYINSFNYVNEMPSGMNEGIRNSIIYDKYGIFLYDKYREVFYRFFNPGYELLEELSFEEMARIDRSSPNTGVMVLDKELNILGEYLFGEYAIHSKSNMFVGEKGLYLSLNNENHADYDEDHFRYMVVRFEVE